ncbi:MAG: T9SS type A sorting domain-containing protein [Muribaculaceae bacterium]|nr:T9SS type A sorting domain-containing protein [Muribaculaceae bacterium]
MKIRRIVPLVLASFSLTATSQQLKSNYIDWGTKGQDFPAALKTWEKGQKWSDDDNFFISRVKPKVRFRNAATQVNPDLTEANDKKLIFWVPVNNETNNALPDGVFDSEVFPMWSYVTHYGNWSAPLIRVPGNFADVAHKNGVPVSAVASVPYGNISNAWYRALTALTECGGEKVADFLEYYGVDGIGYNSEFAANKIFVTNLQKLHEEVISKLRTSGRNPIAEIIWYDGTNDNGSIMFDRGLKDNHNVENWGYGDNIRSSLFFNYNWNSGGGTLLKQSVECAKKYGRSPLDLYCGINMQGKEPKTNTDNIWTLLKDYNLSIGLWGAHSENMFYESRMEKGPAPETRQRTYLRRMENWFTGSTRNPVNTLPVTNSLKIAADDENFFGMSKMMSARSALKWDLGKEPFISYFNLGNGRFFNYRGQRCHDSEWYNIGIQDYLPTWMWWFSTKFMGRNASDVAVGGLNAEFVWDDAWMGGSVLRINGTSSGEYLHLFKTEFPLETGDVVTVRYKIVNGAGATSLVMSAKGSENEETSSILMTASDENGKWIEKTFTIGKDFASMAGKSVAMIALNFKNADNLDMRLGEFSIVRPGDAGKCPDTPVIEKAEILSSRYDGADGKIIFNMPNDKSDDICYNIDVNTSLFKLYAREEGKDPILMGMTTSWAGLMFSIPVEYASGKKLALGVSAMSLDMNAESDIAWSEFMTLDDTYEPSDKVVLSKQVIKPGESFSVGYADKSHETASWMIYDADGNLVGSQDGSCEMIVENGLELHGNYDLVVKGLEHRHAQAVETERTFKAMIQITGTESGNIPEILTADINGDTDSTIKLDKDTESAVINFTGKDGSAVLSRGVRVGEAGVGFRFAESKLEVNSPFTVSFWFKPDDFANKASHLFNIRDKEDKWAVNNWGWFWHTVNENGETDAFTMRMNSGGNVNYLFDETRIEPGVWHHFAYAFDFNDRGQLKMKFFLDGKEQKVTSWTRNDVAQSGEVTYQRVPYTWRENNVVAVGGYLHKLGSVNGNIDNLMVWNSALDEAGVRSAMEDIKEESIPEGLVSFYDFERDYGTDLTFEGKGKAPFRAGAHDYEATEIEGQGVLKWVKPEYCAGAPMLSGSAYDLKTSVSFYNPGGRVTNVKGNSDSGSAMLHFPGEGIYKVGVKMTNEYGSDSRNFVVMVGNSENGVNQIELMKTDVYPNPFESYIDILSAEDGSYRISLSDMEGRRLLVNDFISMAGDTMRVYPEVGSGLYLLTVEKDGKLYSVARVIRK